jgi:hypothetical protein
MTYGLKYYGEFKDYFNNLIRVEIAERNYSGSSSEMVMAENPAQLDYPGDEFDVYRPIFGSQLIISVISITDFQYISLHTADARQYQVTVLKDSVLYWKGWVIPDLFNEPYVAPPYVVNISARCGLGELENVPVPEKVMSYVDGETPVLKSFVNLYSILTYGLRLLNLGLNIKEAINIYNVERTTPPINTDTTLTDTYIDLTQYSGQSLYELISDILKAHTARLYQQDGFWWMVRQKELNDTLRYRILDIDGGSVIGFDDTKLTTFLIGKVQNNHIVNNGPELRINPAWKEFVLNQQRDKHPGILKNPDFDKLTVAPLPGFFWSTAELESWVRVNTNIRLIAGRYPYIEPNQNNQWTKYIYQEFRLEECNFQALRIRFSIAVTTVGVGGLATGNYKVAFGINMTGESGNYSIQSTNDGFGSWTSPNNLIVIEKVASSDTLSLNIQTYEIMIREIPDNGICRFAIFGAQNQVTVLEKCQIDILEIVNPEATNINLILREYESVISDTISVNPNNNFIPSPIEVYGGDLPDVPNANKIWKFGYNEVNGTRTRIWNNFGETNEIPLLQHLANDYKKMYLLPQWVLSLPILSENIKFDSSIVDYQVLSKKYRIVSASFNIRDSICEGIFAEVGAWEGDGTGNQWILKTGYWNDNGIWIDTEVWQIPE